MRRYVGLVIVFFCVIYLLFFSVQSLLIGLGKWKNPIYDTPEKKKYILKRGIIGTVVCSIGFVFFIVILFIIVLS